MSENDAPQLTHHAMLIPWGQFAQCLGLIERLSAESLQQKTVDHTPQAKVIEFLVANLAGLAHLKEISLSAHPLDQDKAVAQAWGQTGWADYSGVSRTLAALTPQETEAILKVLQTISSPFIDKEALLAIKQEGRLILDGDLSGRPVSNTSRTYPEVAYGHMDDQIHLGYQAALVSLQSPTYGRLWLTVTQHPGDTVSCTEAEPMVRRSEAILGLRPMRRVALLRQRLEAVEKNQPELKGDYEKAKQALEQERHTLDEVSQQVTILETQVREAETVYAEKQRLVRPHSQLAQRQIRLAGYVKRQKRKEAAVGRAERRLQRQHKTWQACLAEISLLRQRLEQFEQDNLTNTAPVQAIFRLDAGFGTADNVALLIEMGYELYSKPHGNWLTGRLEHWTDEHPVWERVGHNAEMVAWSSKDIPDFPYPLDVALERFHTGQQVRLGGLIHFGQDPVTAHLTTWFERYNQRQTIEAGNKEEKGVFELQHLKVRSRSGILLQEQFVAFAANFVRWATLWLTQDCSNIPDGWLDLDHPHIKDQVKIGAQSLAWVSWYEQGCLLKFEDHSIFAGRSLNVKKRWSFQLVLPFAKSCYFSPF
jgi:hypothetical protein